MQRTFEILGITSDSAKEFATGHMNLFNEVCEDAHGVDYFSVGSKKKGAIMTEVLRIGHDIVINDEFGDQTDGLVRDEEARWGEYLITYENDHFEVIGF